MPNHHEIKVLPYTASQMYALVADVPRYPEFLPWNSAARVRSRTPTPEGEVLDAELVISFKVFREKFGSRVSLIPARHRIETEYLDGPFRHLQSTWSFRDLPTGGCEVDFSVDFEFRNAILRAVIGVVFNDAMQRIVRAFERRAAALYAPKPA